MKKIIIFCLTVALLSTNGIYSQSVSINTDGSNADASSILDVKATDKGVLIPRVSLTDVASASPVSSPASGLLVYNTNATVTGGHGVGFYVWNGTSWIKLVQDNDGAFIRNQNTTDQTANFRITGIGRANTSFQSPIYTRADAGTVAIRPHTDATNAIQLQNATGTPILNVDATNSRVGIGTVTPTNPLSLESTSSGTNFLLSLRTNSSATGIGVGIKFTNTNGTNMDLGSGEIVAIRNLTGGNADFSFRLANNTPTMSERFTITGIDGFVGINSHNAAAAAFAPTTALHIRDRNTSNNEQVSIEKFSNTVGQYTGIRFRVSSNTPVNENYKGAIYFERTETAGRGSLHFATNDANVNATNVSPSDIRMTITRSGNVGIGTTAPTTRLDVDGNLRIRGLTASGVAVNDASGNISSVSPGTSGNVLISDGTNWTSGNASGTFIQNQNSVNQTADFRISGTGRANTSFQSPIYTRADAGTVAIRPHTDATNAIQLQNAAGTSILNLDATNQRVGIGTTTPNFLLDVEGGTMGNTNYGNQAGLNLRRANGTQASPADVTTDGSTIGQINFAYRIGGDFGITARIRSDIEGTASGAGDRPANLTFWTTADGSGSIQERMRIGNNGEVRINNLAGTGNRNVYADADGTLRTGSTARFMHATYHPFNNANYRGPSTVEGVMWLPSPGGDGSDDCWDCNIGVNNSSYRRVWNAPYAGRLVKVIIRIVQDSGSNPDIQGVIRLNVNGTNYTGTAAFSINDSGVQTITLPTTGFSFNAEDRLALALVRRGNNSDRFEDLDIIVTAVWEYIVTD